jgi:hypothetical protein
VSSLIDQVDEKVACAQRDFSRSQRARYLLAGGLWRSSNCALAETQEQRFSNPLGNLALRVAATLPNLVNSRATAWGLGVVVVTLISAGAVRATIPNLRATPKAPTFIRPAEMLSTTMPKTAPRILRPTSSPSSSGFSVLTATAAESLTLPAMTVGEMMLIAHPLALASTEPNPTTTAPNAEEPLNATPKVKVEEHVTRTPKLKPKLKRKLARQEPQHQQQIPWWSRLPLLGVR